jgi:hypothetical protein
MDIKFQLEFEGKNCFGEVGVDVKKKNNFLDLSN